MSISENYTGDDDEDIGAKDFKIATGNVSKNSYNIGITDGKEMASQIGFDQGYADGIAVSLTISKIKAFVEILKSSNFVHDQKLLNELESFENKWPETALIFENCTILDQLDNSIKDITELQREQMRTIEKELTKLFPTISSYLLNDEYNKIKI